MDVVPSAFVTKSYLRMATKIGENSHPALQTGGRNSNPLVANVFPPAFAIQNFLQAARQTVARQFAELSRLRETGKRTRGLPTFAGRSTM
jgi:hypothetical protein